MMDRRAIEAEARVEHEIRRETVNTDWSLPYDVQVREMVALIGRLQPVHEQELARRFEHDRAGLYVHNPARAYSSRREQFACLLDHLFATDRIRYDHNQMLVLPGGAG